MASDNQIIFVMLPLQFFYRENPWGHVSQGDKSVINGSLENGKSTLVSRVTRCIKLLTVICKVTSSGLGWLYHSVTYLVQKVCSQYHQLYRNRLSESVATHKNTNDIQQSFYNLNCICYDPGSWT